MFLSTRLKMIAGSVLLVTLLALAGVALTPQLTGEDLAADRAAVAWRSPGATRVFLDLTAAASEAVGLAALAVGVIVLLLRRRRWDAARLFVMAGAAWALALAVKHVFDRSRPPSSLWLLTPDPTGSFPSGHDTTATVILVVVAMALVGTGAIRAVVTSLAVAFALAVGVSRVYLGDHYPSDVVGSYLSVAVAVLLVSAVADLPPVRTVGARVLRLPALAPGHSASHRGQPVGRG